jgi:hypothetical protein
MTITLNGTTGITNDGGYTGDGVVFADTTPANTLVTTTGGNVGIGTSSPAQKLEVNGILRIGGSAYSEISNNGSAGREILQLRAKTVLADGAGMNLYGDGDSSNPGIINFYTDNTERARIDSSGKLLVGTTSGATATTENGCAISGSDIVIRKESGTLLFLRRWGTNGDVVDFRNTSNTSVGKITTAASSTTYSTSSDYRLKHDIQPMTGALAKVAQLKPVTYKWNADDSQSQGFIAHELQEVVPWCVIGEKDEVDADGKPVYQGIDTSFLVATLTAAIQEQQALITQLQADVAALKGQE